MAKISKYYSGNENYLNSMIEVISQFIEKNRSASDIYLPDGTIYLENLTTYGTNAWKHKFYAGCNANELNWLKSHFDLPIELEAFYKEFNGLTLFYRMASINGFRDLYSKRGLDSSPYDLSLFEIDERPNEAPSSYFYIGSCADAMARIVYDRNSSEILLCKRNTIEPFYIFPSFSDFLNRFLNDIGPFGFSLIDQGEEDLLNAFITYLRSCSPPMYSGK